MMGLNRARILSSSLEVYGVSTLKKEGKYSLSLHKFSGYLIFHLLIIIAPEILVHLVFLSVVSFRTSRP